MATGHVKTKFLNQPPLKGSFPLDRQGECKELKQVFLQCLKANKQDNAKCRLESKNYLVCRMNKNLMEKEPLEKIGYRDLAEKKNTEEKKNE